MNLMYESLVYLLNLWIVFTETDGFTIILNALALEFILKLDDDMKLIYMDTFPPDVRVLNAYRKENCEPDAPEANRCIPLTERTNSFLGYLENSSWYLLYVTIPLLSSSDCFFYPYASLDLTRLDVTSLDLTMHDVM